MKLQAGSNSVEVTNIDVANEEGFIRFLKGALKGWARMGKGRPKGAKNKGPTVKEGIRRFLLRREHAKNMSKARSYGRKAEKDSK